MSNFVPSDHRPTGSFVEPEKRGCGAVGNAIYATSTKGPGKAFVLAVVTLEIRDALHLNIETEQDVHDTRYARHEQQIGFAVSQRDFSVP